MPNRIIKESIRTSKAINGLTDFQFRIWVYLITYVDDFGRGSADPELIKGLVLPRRKRVTESDIEAALAALAGMGCIVPYSVGGESYFYFPNWSSHQRIQNKKPKYPEPITIHGDTPKVTVTHGDSPPQSESVSESNTNPESESSRASAQGHGGDDDAAALRLQLTEIEAAALSIGLPFAARDGQTANLLVAEYGGHLLLKAIERAADRPADKRSWGYIKGILRNWREKGGPDDARMADAGEAANPAGQRDGGNAYSRYRGGIQRL